MKIKCPGCGRFMMNNTPPFEKHVDEWFCTNSSCIYRNTLFSCMEM